MLRRAGGLSRRLIARLPGEARFSGLGGDTDVLARVTRPDNAGVKLRAKDALWETLGH